MCHVLIGSSKFSPFPMKMIQTPKIKCITGFFFLDNKDTNRIFFLLIIKTQIDILRVKGLLKKAATSKTKSSISQERGDEDQASKSDSAPCLAK